MKFGREKVIEIFKKLEDDFGETVLYRPKFDMQTAVLWLSPNVGLQEVQAKDKYAHYGVKPYKRSSINTKGERNHAGSSYTTISLWRNNFLVEKVAPSMNLVMTWCVKYF